MSTATQDPSRNQLRLTWTEFKIHLSQFNFIYFYNRLTGSSFFMHTKLSYVLITWWHLSLVCILPLTKLQYIKLQLKPIQYAEYKRLWLGSFPASICTWNSQKSLAVCSCDPVQAGWSELWMLLCWNCAKSQAAHKITQTHFQKQTSAQNDSHTHAACVSAQLSFSLIYQ